jgi:cysteine dioxygenase
VDQIKDALKHSTEQSELLKILHTKFKPSILSTFELWKEGKYTRNLIYEDKDMSLILMCWSPNTQSVIHNHDQSECFVRCIKGILHEEHFEDMHAVNESRSHIFNINAGECTTMSHDIKYHRIINSSSECAVTLHCYSPPITSCRAYCCDSEKFITCKPCYDF